MPALVQVLHDYGWAGVVVIMLGDRIFPFFATKFFPAYQRKAQAEDDRRTKELEARIARDKEEQDHRHQMENRTVSALELLTTTNQDIRLLLTTINDRMGGLEHAHQDIPHKVLPKPKPKRRKAA